MENSEIQDLLDQVDQSIRNAAIDPVCAEVHLANSIISLKDVVEELIERTKKDVK